ncbi:hypothetical protein M514_24478 [Trichuris suis]|uniref:Uncharacterized protein n=1 Tax=Trichuris suis TaxID=68888 RepID=A0A085N1F2_9BILA|nr:hypothetical protein M514_24478 [Trichuris suis]
MEGNVFTIRPLINSFHSAFFIIFLGCHRGMNSTAILSSSSEKLPPPARLAHPLEAMARLFMVNVGEFQILYKVLDTCRLATLGKVALVVVLILSAKVLSLLIAINNNCVAFRTDTFRLQRSNVPVEGYGRFL